MTSVSHYVTSASRYQSRSLMYIRSPISRHSGEFAEAVPITDYFALFVLMALFACVLMPIFIVP